MLFILEFVGNLASFIGYPFIWLLIHKTTSWSWREILLYYLQRLYFDGLYRVAGTYIFSLFFIFCMFPYKFFHLICENFVRLIFNCLKPAFESRWIKRQCNLNVILKQLFCNFFCQQHSLMNRPGYNNLFQVKEQENFRNLNWLIFCTWKHIKSKVNAFWNILKLSCRPLVFTSYKTSLSASFSAWFLY